MIQLTDFINICRLCLTKHENSSVNLFSTRNAVKNVEETNELSVAEVVESFCNIEIRDGDDLPEYICNECWSIVSAMQNLQQLSIKSDQILNNILNSDSSKAVNDTDEHLDFKIEFIDAQSNAKEEALSEPKENRGSNKKNVKKGTKKKYSEKKISCEMCGKLVASNFIEFHLNVHKDIRPYKCEADDCDKTFTSPVHVRQHFRKVHVYSITRPYKCDVCGRGFVQSSALAMHRSYHFDPQIPCSICGQLYRNKRALQRHFLVHSGERKYQCSECKKSFQTSFTLKTHMRTHTLEKPFSCSECTKTFAYKCLLKSHLEKHHPNVNR